MRTFRRFLVGLILACSAVSSARTPGPERNFENLIRRVLLYGSSATLQSPVARTLGITATEVPVHRFRYQERSETMEHLCIVTVAPFYRRLIVLASVDPNDGSGTLWSVSPKGRVVATLAVDGGGAVTQISNADFRGEFAAEKEYFFRKLGIVDRGSASRPEEERR